MRRLNVATVIVVIFLLLIVYDVKAQEGQIVTETVYSPSLEGNLLGDSPDRLVNIYLPPSYETQLDRYYPVVYLLHGITGTHNYFTSRFGNILNSMKFWIERGTVKEMIIVMPNSYNKFRGSFYTNSSTAGNWADYIAKDLVEYIDSHYRTLPYRASRAVVGHSMGGYGAIKLGMFFPDTFGCMGGLAGAYMIEELELQDKANYYAFDSTVESWGQWSSLSFLYQAYFAFSSALAPNPDNPPFYCDLPYVYTDSTHREVIKVQEVYDKFLEHDILRLAEKHSEALLSMRAIYIDCGINDDFNFIENARRLHEKLKGLGVEHFYKEFAGNHTNRIMSSTGDALELFSSAMSFEMLADEYPTNPIPVDGDIYAGTKVKIEWSPAVNAVSHDVYFSDNFDDVNEGAGEAFQGNHIPTYLVVGLPGSSYPDGLIYETTYYWRVNEINDTEPNNPSRGPVWSFTIVPGIPVAYWKLDEEEGNIAYNNDSDNHGILNGGPTWRPGGGQIAGALELDGINDYISTDFVLDPSLGAFSIFVWIKGGALGQAIISQVDGTGIGDSWLGITSSDGRLMTELVPPPIGRFISQPLESNYIITDDIWHHVGFVWDGSHRTLYVDGIEVSKDTNPLLPLKYSDGGLYIGANKNLDAGTFFSGLIDDVRIYNVALTEEGIASLSH